MTSCFHFADQDSGTSRKFRDRRPDESRLFPPSPQDWLPEKHLVHFLLDVSQKIDTSRIVDDDDSDKGGQPPFHPRMMLVLLLYAYSVGVFSSRKIMNRRETDVAFRIIVGEDNMESLDANERIDNVFIATGRQKHNECVPSSPPGRPPNNLTAKQKMAHRNRTKQGQNGYARRGAIIESG